MEIFHYLICNSKNYFTIWCITTKIFLKSTIEIMPRDDDSDRLFDDSDGLFAGYLFYNDSDS